MRRRTAAVVSVLVEVLLLCPIFTSSTDHTGSVRSLPLLDWGRPMSPRFPVFAALLALVAAGCGTPATPGSARPPVSALPRVGALTMAGEAGQVLVGVTLDPGRPGPNVLSAFLQPPQGAQVAAGLRATVDDGTTTKALQSCGDTCRWATVTLHTRADLSIDVLGPTGGVARFSVPQVPAPSGQALLAQAQSRMHRLHSYRDHNTLFGGSGPTIVTDTVAQAPDRAQWTVDGNDTIWIGTTQYTRAGPTQPWSRTTGLDAARYPWFIWDPFAPLVDAHVIGQAVIDGTPTTEVAFFGSDPSIPVWFDVWIAPGGLVLQSQMLAQAHFMHDTYSAFDDPVSIAAPIPG
jgi:hypothetical protein